MLANFLQSYRQSNAGYFHHIIENSLIQKGSSSFDLGPNNTELCIIIKNKNIYEFDKYLCSILEKENSTWAIGGYLEKRIIYQSDAYINKELPRDIHLGVDIWCKAYTKIYTLCDGVIFSYQDNAQDGDYGPTIIIQHHTEGVIRYSLYGHLSRNSLDCIYVGKTLKRGELLGYVGPYPENGNRPPHLHFQIIHDMEGNSGDYPGVCQDIVNIKEYYKRNCPNPMIVL